MAVNNSRDMTAELHQGIVDGSYMQFAPDTGGAVQPRPERASWPTYRQVGLHVENAFETHPLWCGCSHEVHTSGTPTNGRRTGRI